MLFIILIESKYFFFLTIFIITIILQQNYDYLNLFLIPKLYIVPYIRYHVITKIFYYLKKQTNYPPYIIN